jgi:hypothetical protein
VIEKKGLLPGTTHGKSEKTLYSKGKHVVNSTKSRNILSEKVD